MQSGGMFLIQNCVTTHTILTIIIQQLKNPWKMVKYFAGRGQLNEATVDSLTGFKLIVNNLHKHFSRYLNIIIFQNLIQQILKPLYSNTSITSPDNISITN